MTATRVPVPVHQFAQVRRSRIGHLVADCRCGFRLEASTLKAFMMAEGHHLARNQKPTAR